MGHQGLFVLAVVLALFFTLQAAQGLVLVGSGPFHAALFERLSTDYAFQRDDVKLAYSLAPPADTCQALALYDQGLVDFVSTSYPMATDDACGPPGGTPYNSSTDALVQVPVAATAVALGYRLDALNTGNETELVLSAAILVGILNGTVTHWDHPLVTGLNPTLLGGFAGPITLVYSPRRNSPGNIGDVLEAALRSASPAFGAWLDSSYGGNLTLALAACPAAVEAVDPVGSVNATDGAITYCPIEEASKRGLPHASMMNRAGYKVKANAASVAAAMGTLAANATMSQKLSIVNSAANGSWPLANMVLATMRLNRRLVEKKVDCLYIRETLSFLSWSQINSAAAGSAGQLGFYALSFGYKRLGTNLLQSVLCNGVPAVGKGILFGNGSPNEVYQTLTQSFSSNSFSLKYFGSTTAGGIAALKAREADFAIISTALSPADQLAMPHVKPVPFTAMAIAPAYNIPAISGLASLVLSMEVISDIYMDRITKWNHPDIVALNPLLNGSLPDADIRLIYQSSFSTITYIYSRALSLVVPEFSQNINWGYTIDFPAADNPNTVGVDSLDVMQVVQDTPNSLAMWTSNYDAKERQAKPASMINRDGETVAVSQDTMASSINALIAESPVEIFWAPGPNSWPILTVNSLLLDTRQQGDCARLESLVEWLYWSQTSADALGTIFASGLGVPSASGPFVKAMLLNYVADIKCDDAPVSALAGCIHNGTLCSDMGSCIQGSCFCDEGRTGAWCEEWKQDSSSADTVLIVLLSVIIPLALLLLLVLALVAVFVCWQQRRRNNAQEDWQILPEMLEFGESLGNGSYGEVHKAMWKGTEVAVKVIKRADVTREMEASFKDEARTMARLRHPNVVLFMAACTKPPNMCIVMEYMALGSLWYAHVTFPSHIFILCVSVGVDDLRLAVVGS
jgi:ABC-type phosphate transport system substrate-binding protein